MAIPRNRHTLPFRPDLHQDFPKTYEVVEEKTLKSFHLSPKGQNIVWQK